MRRLRYVMTGGALKLLLVRTQRDSPFLRPDPDGEVNALVLGVLAKAQTAEDVDIIAVTVLPHLVLILAWFHDAPQMKGFMHFFDGNLSKVIGNRSDVRQRGGSLWRDRYRHVDVRDVAEDQVAVLKEVLAAPCEAGYVDRPSDWPGVHSADVLSQGGNELRGVWHCRKDGTTEEVVVRLTPLPCWAQCSVPQRRGMVRRLLREIESETARQRRRTGQTSCGAAAVLALDPREGPDDVPRWETPWFFALDEAARRKMRDAYMQIVEKFRKAADALWQVEVRVPFPEGTFPPPLPLAVSWPARPP